MKKLFLLAAGFIGARVGLSCEDQEVVAYGLEVTFSIFISLVLALALGRALGIAGEILVVALVWVTMRSFAGGAHCGTLWRCAFSSALLMLCAGGAAASLSALWGQKLLVAVILCCGLVAVVLTLLWAPADNPAKRILSESRRRKLRGNALLVEIILTVCLSATCLFTGTAYSSLLLAGGLAMGAEAFTVSPSGYRAMAYLDRALGLLDKALWKGGEKG